MGQVVGRTASSFRSLDYGQFNTGNHAVSVRRALDTPRLLLNMMHTDNGKLWMPPAPTTAISNITGTGDLQLIRHTFSPGGFIVVQKGTTVSVYNVDSGSIPFTVADATFTLTTDEKIWTLVSDDKLYFGNSTQTVRMGPGTTFTDITSASVPDGYHSMMYRNRRFVVERVFGVAGGTDRRLHYSDIGTPETFGANSFIDVEGYYEGDSWESAIGSPVAIHPFSDVLALFNTQGIVRFTGTDPTTNFTLRPSMSSVGLWMRDSVSDIAPGLVFFGGTPRGEFGFYLWSGNSSQLISEGLNGYLREWVEEGQSFDEGRSDACVWRNRYICAIDLDLNPSGTDEPTLFVYDWARRVWSTFNGWTRPTIGLARDGTDRLMVGEAADDVIYTTNSPMFRATATTPARLRVGFEDEEQPSGLARYQKVRLTVNAKAAGGAGIDFDLTATLSDGTTYSPPTQTLTTNGQFTLDYPLRLRGNGIDLDFTITPDTATQEVVVENLELVQSRKPLKVARIGGE